MPSSDRLVAALLGSAKQMETGKKFAVQLDRTRFDRAVKARE